MSFELPKKDDLNSKRIFDNFRRSESDSDKIERRIAWIIYQHMEGAKGDYSTFLAQVRYIKEHISAPGMASKIEKAMDAANTIISEFRLDEQ